MKRFPLGPAVSEETRGVDPDVLRDIGYELPFDHQDNPDEEKNRENPHWPTVEHRAIGGVAMLEIRETLRNTHPPQPRG